MITSLHSSPLLPSPDRNSFFSSPQEGASGKRKASPLGHPPSEGEDRSLPGKSEGRREVRGIFQGTAKLTTPQTRLAVPDSAPLYLSISHPGRGNNFLFFLVPQKGLLQTPSPVALGMPMPPPTHTHQLYQICRRHPTPPRVNSIPSHNTWLKGPSQRPEPPPLLFATLAA